jgi:hypothetical protein
VGPAPEGAIYWSELSSICRRLKSVICSFMLVSARAFSSANLIHFSAIKRKLAATSGSEASGRPRHVLALRL